MTRTEKKPLANAKTVKKTPAGSKTVQKQQVAKSFPELRIKKILKEKQIRAVYSQKFPKQTLSSDQKSKDRAVQRNKEQKRIMRQNSIMANMIINAKTTIPKRRHTY